MAGYSRLKAVRPLLASFVARDIHYFGDLQKVSEAASSPNQQIHQETS